jgi:hypothetical protein
MVSITVPLDKEFKDKMDEFPWVNWSEVGREELLKREIFDQYVKTGEVSDEDWKFCEKTDWHPVDELPVKEGYSKKLKSVRKEKAVRYKSVDEFFEELR